MMQCSINRFDPDSIAYGVEITEQIKRVVCIMFRPVQFVYSEKVQCQQQNAHYFSVYRVLLNMKKGFRLTILTFLVARLRAPYFSFISLGSYKPDCVSFLEDDNIYILLNPRSRVCMGYLVQ